MASWDRAVAWPPTALNFVCGPCVDAGRPPQAIALPWLTHSGCVNAGGKNGLPVCSACKTSIKSDAQHAWCSPACYGILLNQLRGPAPGGYAAPRNKNPCPDWAAYQAVLARPKFVGAPVRPPAQATPARRTIDPDEEAESVVIVKERAQEALAIMQQRGHTIPTILVLDVRQQTDEVITCNNCGYTGKISVKRNASDKWSGAAMALDCKKPTPKATP